MNPELARYLAGTSADAPSPVARPSRRRKPNPVVVKILGYRQFLDGLPDLEPRLSPGAVAVWCWLWGCEREGLALCTAGSLSDRFRVSESTAKRWLAELRLAGFLTTVSRGLPGRTASVVRVRCTRSGD